MNTDLFLKIAKFAAYESGKIQIKHLGNVHDIKYKGDIDIVTEVDLLCEKKIKEIISENFPDHSILAEESDLTKKESEFKWIIDPLDGTTNYAHSFPFFSTSIALEFKNSIITGVVFEPVRNEMFYAKKGFGAFLNDKKISVSKTNNLKKSLLATGFSYDIKKDLENNLIHFENFLTTTMGIRRAGSAAIDLCYVACGRFDGYWEAKLAPWDTAAGALIVKEAGGTVSNYEGKKYNIYKSGIVASNTSIHKNLIETISPTNKTV